MSDVAVASYKKARQILLYGGDDNFWLLETMLRFQRILQKAKEESPEKMLSKKQILEEVFPEAAGDKEAMQIARFNVKRRLKLNLKQGLMVKKRNSFENYKTVYYGLR